jgi:hypothetical protein
VRPDLRRRGRGAAGLAIHLRTVRIGLPVSDLPRRGYGRRPSVH